MTDSDWLDAIEARLRAATPGPWDWSEGNLADDWPVFASSGESIGGCPDCGVRAGFEKADAEFIVNAPTDIAALVAAVRERDAEIERLHQVEFIHNGCDGLRRSDNAYLIERAEKAEDDAKVYEQQYRDAVDARVAAESALARVEALAADFDGGQYNIFCRLIRAALADPKETE